MHRPRSISNKQRQTWISRHSSIHPRETIRIGTDSHRILEIKKGGGGGRYREDGKANNGEITNKRGKLNFQGEESNGEKEELLSRVGTIYFVWLQGAQKRIPPQMQPFAKYRVQYTYIEIPYTLLHAFYRSSNVSFSPTFALYRFEVESF